METEWAENRAKLPQDLIRKTIGKLLDGMYSTGERDKFRTRLERNAQGGVEIYITHRGLQEIYPTKERDSTTWTVRPSDPDLEAELLALDEHAAVSCRLIDAATARRLARDPQLLAELARTG